MSSVVIKSAIVVVAVVLTSNAYGETYRDWQPYKDYQKLPASYHSEKMERMYRNSYGAQKKVKNVPCKTGGTIEQCLNKKAAIPAATDYGWNTYPLDNGTFEVAREINIGGLSAVYKWEVGSSGAVKPTNGKAIGISR